MDVYHDYSYRGDPGEFIGRVTRIPNLTEGQEKRLLAAFRRNQDPKALHLLFASHQKLIVGEIRKRRLMPKFDEALSAGNEGLHRAIKKFSPDKNVRLATYAGWWIRAGLFELYDTNSVVKAGTSGPDKHARIHLVRELRRVVPSDREPNDRDLKAIAEKLGVPLMSVQKAYFSKYKPDVSIDAGMVPGSDEPRSLYETMADTAPGPDEIVAQIDAVAHMRARLQDAMQYLDERQRYIFTARRLEDPERTLADLGEVFNISRERVRQIEMKALEKIQSVIHKGTVGLAKDNDVPKKNARSRTAARHARPEPVA